MIKSLLQQIDAASLMAAGGQTLARSLGTSEGDRAEAIFREVESDLRRAHAKTTQAMRIIAGGRGL